MVNPLLDIRYALTIISSSTCSNKQFWLFAQFNRLQEEFPRFFLSLSSSFKSHILDPSNDLPPFNNLLILSFRFFNMVRFFQEVTERQAQQHRIRHHLSLSPLSHAYSQCGLDHLHGLPPVILRLKLSKRQPHVGTVVTARQTPQICHVQLMI